MEHTVGVAIASQDVAALIDSGSSGEGGTRKVKRAESAPTQQIAMGYTADSIPSDNVAAGIEPGRIG
ncbi:MAG: hypothetical protein ACR2I2_00095, partial [Bryobacteraceae bacterium]